MVEVEVEEEGVVVVKKHEGVVLWPLYSAHWAVMIDRVEDVVARDRPPRAMARAP